MLVAFERVSKRYDGGVRALDDVSLTIERSSCVQLSGPCGAGKSTLLRLIAGLERVSTGTVRVGGEDVGKLSPRGLAMLRRSIGIVPQQLLLLDDRSVLDNVALPAQVAGLSRATARQRAAAALTRVRLDPDAHTVRPQTLSGGEQQRVALARAIVNRPALLLADEPSANLDSTSAAALAQLFGEFVVAGVTLVVATHGPLPLPLSPRVVAIDKGRVLA